MVKFLVVSILTVMNIFALVNLEWSHKYFGSIKEMKFADLNGDGLNEIIVGGENGIFALSGNNGILWSIQNSSSVGKIKTFQFDSDVAPEIAATTWLDGYIIDNNGSIISQTNLVSGWAVSNQPLAILNEKAISYYEDYNSKGLVHIGEYAPFFDISQVPSNGLYTIDSNLDGSKDTLYAINYNNTLYALDKDGNELWRKSIDTSYGYLNYLWAGYRLDRKKVILLGTADGYVLELDENGDIIWHTYLYKPIKKIEHFKKGGFYVVFNDYNLGNLTYDAVTLLGENNGDRLWTHESYKYPTRAMAVDDSLMAASYGTDVGLFDEHGVLIEKTTLSQIKTNSLAFDVNSLSFGKYNSNFGLYIGTMDINRLNDDNSTTTVFSGGSLVQKLYTGDINGDGNDEIALSDENRLYLYDINGKLLWKKDGYTLSDKIGFDDFNGDGKSELIALNKENLEILDENGNIIWSRPSYYSNIYPDIVLSDYDGDGLDDIFISSLNQDTQNYDLRVYSGKDGSTLHTFGSVERCSYINIVNIKGEKEFYFDDFGTLKRVGLDGNVSSSKYSSLFTPTDNLAIFRDIDNDGVIDGVLASYDSENLYINLYDLTKEGTTDALKDTITISANEEVKDLKVLDYNDDGVYEFLVAYPSKLVLYNKDGEEIWKQNTVDKFGDNRMLSKITILGNLIFASGKELYIFDKNGNKLQDINPTNYASGSEYYLPFDIAISNNSNIKLIVGSMGVFAYGGIQTDISDISKISYKSGWNLVATPTNYSIPLSEISSLLIAWEYDNGEWKVYTTNEADSEKAEDLNISKFESIVPKKGVWIKTSSDGEVIVNGNPNEIPSLKNGWNLVGGVGMSVENLHKIYENSDIFWKYKDGQWIGKCFIDGTDLNNLSQVDANEGFWVHTVTSSGN